MVHIEKSDQWTLVLKDEWIGGLMWCMAFIYSEDRVLKKCQLIQIDILSRRIAWDRL